MMGRTMLTAALHKASSSAGIDPDGDGVKLLPPSEGHAPDGPHGRAAVHALGRTKTTGNFKRIEEAEGKGAAIAAYQNALKHK